MINRIIQFSFLITILILPGCTTNSDLNEQSASISYQKLGSPVGDLTDDDLSEEEASKFRDFALSVTEDPGTDSISLLRIFSKFFGQGTEETKARLIAQREAMTGYSSFQLDSNIFKITYKGNHRTKKERINNFALLRSAEITIENGFKYFIIINSDQYSTLKSYTSPVTAETEINPDLSGGLFGPTATTTISGGETTYSESPTSSNTIICFKEKPEGFSYNARFLEKSLKQKYNIK